MKFRIRPGFTLFNSMDDQISWETMGARSGVVPKAKAGDVIHLTSTQVGEFGCAGALGKLEPLDEEAIAAFGNTPPIISRLISHPHEYAPLVPSTTTTTTEVYEQVYRRRG